KCRTERRNGTRIMRIYPLININDQLMDINRWNLTTNKKSIGNVIDNNYHPVDRNQSGAVTQ
ncbi:hypothetical protein, partial [Yokenella regensburgei]|uniref:hypothetical protein n=1 Tax=Yokenella regensburgei TaxID=158877 RepID=UPI001ED915E9